jgi:citrate synthase
MSTSRWNLYPNVDFYSGIIYKVGDSTDMFSDVCSGRLPGWIGRNAEK